MKYMITRTHMVHEGGTKFYDVYRVINDDSKCPGVGFTNYGIYPSRAPTAGILARVKTKGKIHTRSNKYQVANWQSSLIRTKSRRGYGPVPGEVALGEITFQTDGLAEFIAKLRQVFGPNNTTEMLDYMGLNPDSISSLVTEMTEIDHAIIEPVKEPEPARCALWATW